jgi:hypothetical protein
MTDAAALVGGFALLGLLCSALVVGIPIVITGILSALGTMLGYIFDAVADGFRSNRK